MSNRKKLMNHIGPAIHDGGPGKVANYQPVYCHTCCVLAKRAAITGNEAEPVLPCITWEIQVYNNMPVSVPICQIHLAAEKQSSLIT